MPGNQSAVNPGHNRYEGLLRQNVDIELQACYPHMKLFTTSVLGRKAGLFKAAWQTHSA